MDNFVFVAVEMVLFRSFKSIIFLSLLDLLVSMVFCALEIKFAVVAIRKLEACENKYVEFIQ